MESIQNRNTKNRRLRLLLCCLLILFCLSWGISARAAPSDRLAIKLSQISPAGGADLTGLRDALNLKIPIPERWRITRAHLKLAYYHSSALLAGRSRLVVGLNGIALAQAVLDPRSPEGFLEADLPPALLTADYNDLTITAILNYTEGCRDPGAPELWANLKLDESYLELEYTWLDLPASLSALATTIFDPKITSSPGVHLVLPDYEPQTLRWAALVAAGVSIRYDYRRVAFTVSRQLSSDKDNIVIGSRDFAASATGLGPERLKDGNLGLFPLPTPASGGDPAFALIVVTGEKPEEIEKAVQAFSILSYPWPDAALAKITEVKLPSIARFSGRSLVTSGKSYLFRDLGLDSRTMRGFNPAPAEMVFRLPGDFLARANNQLNIMVHLAYGAGLRQDSALNLFLNDRFIAAIPLDDARGGQYNAYQVQVPANVLKPGFNKISGQSILMPRDAGPCQTIQPNSLMLTLFGDSEIRIPEFEQWAAMPEIGLFFQDGFPHTAMPDWRNSLIFLTEKDPSLAAAAVNLTAMIAQKTGIPCYGLEFTYDPAKGANKEILALGSMKNMPEALIESSPLSPGLSFPFIGRLPVVKKIEGLFGGPSSDQEGIRVESPDLARMVTDLTLKSGKLLLLEFQSAHTPANTVLLIGAGSNEDLLAGVQGLWDPIVQYQCLRDTVLIDYGSRDKKVFTQKSGPSYYIGHLSRLTWLDRVTHNHPLAFYIVLAVFIILVAYILTGILRRLKQKRLARGGVSS